MSILQRGQALPFLSHDESCSIYCEGITDPITSAV